MSQPRFYKSTYAPEFRQQMVELVAAGRRPKKRHRVWLSWNEYFDVGASSTRSDAHARQFVADIARERARWASRGGDTNSFGDHLDNSIRFAPDTGLRIRTDISCTPFLAEPDQCNAGKLVIQIAGGPRGIRHTAGDAVIYAGKTLHQVAPVTRGFRLACFFWIESMVHANEQRLLLFDLDNTIIGMRDATGDNAANVALTGTSRNLLRMWADT